MVHGTHWCRQLKFTLLKPEIDQLLDFGIQCRPHCFFRRKDFITGRNDPGTKGAFRRFAGHGERITGDHEFLTGWSGITYCVLFVSPHGDAHKKKQEHKYDMSLSHPLLLVQDFVSLSHRRKTVNSAQGNDYQEYRTLPTNCASNENPSKV
jgi:hypothetical protein